MKNKKWIWLLFFLLGFLFFVVGVPVIINECYRSDSGYLTFWGPADVLSYYGTILGSAIAVTTLLITIRFTRKQILRDTYLNFEKGKWEKIELQVIKSIESLNPIPLLKTTIEAGCKSPYDTITIFQKYQMDCRTITDPITSLLSMEDFPKIKPLTDQMITLSEEFMELIDGEIQAYHKLGDIEKRSLYTKILANEKKLPGSFSQEEIVTAKKFIEDTKTINSDTVTEEISHANEKLIEAYEQSYRSLLQLKGSTFDRISTDIHMNADSILCFWRKK